jgi:putative endonuclease
MDDRNRKALGSHGEDRALDYLRRRGLQLVVRNHRCKAGELDLVMLDGPPGRSVSSKSVLAVIEVRYRTSDQFMSAAESVTWRKQRCIIAATNHLTLTHPELRRFPVRFDIVGISPDAGDDGIEWLRGAFEDTRR